MLSLFQFMMFTFGGCSVAIAEISNNFDVLSRENLPKPVSYFTYPLEDGAQGNTEKMQGARFAYPAANVETAYGPNAAITQAGVYPWKFDIGGLILGSVVGLGALLIIPKVAHLLVPELGTAYGHGLGSPYRSEPDLNGPGVNDIIINLERILAENHVNSSECVQKAICSYIQSTTKPKKDYEARSLDENMEKQTLSNGIANFLFDGSLFKSAIENGKQEISCSVLYPKCPFNQESIAMGIKKLMVKGTSNFINTDTNTNYDNDDKNNNINV